MWRDPLALYTGFPQSMKGTAMLMLSESSILRCSLQAWFERKELIESKPTGTGASQAALEDKGTLPFLTTLR